MFGQVWNHGLVRKYVILFGTLFNDVYINRENSVGETIQTLRIPLTYGPKDKFLNRVDSDGFLDRAISVQLPIMSFEMTSMNYAADRKLNTINRRMAVDTTNANKIKYQYSPVPYDMSFELNIMVKNAEDGTRILEQIIPFFTPEWTASVNLIPSMNVIHDIPVILNSVNLNDDYEGTYENRRAMIYTLAFTMKAYIYGPIKKTGGIIKQAEVNIHSNLDTTSTAVAEIVATPGLNANGAPVNYFGVGPAPTTIDIDEIAADDDYGFITTINENI
jgi:hypothetical protein